MTKKKVPLVENYIDKAKFEPLHLKNNVTKELFMKYMNLVLLEIKIPPSVKCFKEIHPEYLFHKFIHFVRHDMNCNYLVKKVIGRFNGNKETKRERDFEYLFTGKENYNYMQNFPNLVFMMKIYVKN